MMHPQGKQEVVEAVLIAALTTLVTGAITLALKRIEEALERRDKDKDEKPE